MMIVSSCLILAMALALEMSDVSAANVFFNPNTVKYLCDNKSLGTILLPGIPVHLADVNTTHNEQKILLSPIMLNTTIPNARKRTKSM